MVLLYGIPGDGPFELVADALEAAGRPFLLLNPRQFHEIDFIFHMHDNGMEGEITVGAKSYPLSDFTGIYYRALDFSSLPEASALDPASREYITYSELFALLNQWIEIAPCMVLNRHAAMSSNASKPYQLTLISNYFEVPDTLITNSETALSQFREEHPEIIYKSASSIRSIVKTITKADDIPLHPISYCPTLFQQKLNGHNYRVHVVADQLFAIKVFSETVDYRYSHKEGKETTLVPVDLPAAVAGKCIALAKALELPLAGIDLFETDDGKWLCFEVNPSPGFSYFEHHTGQEISKAIAELLSAP